MLKSRETILALAILALLAVIATRFPAFVLPANLAAVFTDTSPLIILALGQMAVILTKCIDLSVAANLALCGMISAMLNGMGLPLPLILLAVLALGAALGVSPPAIAELLPALEAVMVRRVNEQIAANRD